ncbi:hypothetical protein SFC43_27875 [Bacteroides sp. CR5/BHMF/2]|nr:hypothetical protein [Bacteroides sp. CR5/BHMF/2]
MVGQAVGKRGKEAENKQRKRYKTRVSEEGAQSAETPASKGENPMETSRVEKSREKKSK